MGILNMFGGNDSVDKSCDTAVSLAALAAIEMCQRGSIAQVPGAIGVKDAAATLIVTSALLHAAMFCASFDYIARNDMRVPRDTFVKTYNAISRAGDGQFHGEFSRVWHFSNQCIHSPEAEQRIMSDANGDVISLRMSGLVECVNWALQALNRGIPSSLMTRNQMAFLKIVQDFDGFCMKMAPELRF